MSKLTPKQMKFARGLADGMSQASAFSAAGYRPSDSNASTLARSPAIVEEIRRLARGRAEVEQKALGFAIEKAGLSKAWVIERLMRNAAICLGEETITIREQVRLRGEESKVVELEVTQRDAGAANRALELLGREIGMFVDKTVSTVRHVISDKPMSKADWAAEFTDAQPDQIAKLH
jgi:hypothetical protein